MFTIEIPDGTWAGFGRVVRLPDIAELVLGPEMRAPAEEWLAVNTSQPEAIGRGGGCPFELFTRAHAPTAVSALHGAQYLCSCAAHTDRQRGHSHHQADPPGQALPHPVPALEAQVGRNVAGDLRTWPRRTGRSVR